MSESTLPPSLNQHVKILSGFAFSSVGFNQLEGMPLIRIRDLANANTEVRFRGQYDAAYLIKNGDVLIGMDGDFEVHRWNGGDALLNQRVCKVEAATHQIDQDFLYWYLKPKVAEIHRRTPQTTVRHLSTKDLFAIPMPPMGAEEQAVIGRVLDTLETAVRETEAVVAKLKLIKQGLLHDLLTRGIDENGELRSHQSETPHLYKGSPLGWIPQEWNCVALKERLKRTTYGFTNPMPTVDDGPWMLTAADISAGQIRYEQARRTTWKAFRQLSEKSRPQIGDVLVTKDGTLGRVAIVDRNDICVNQSVAVLSPRETHDANYLSIFLQSPVGQQIMLADSGGSTIKHLYITKLAEMVVPWPSTTEGEAIALRVSEMNGRLATEKDYLAKLTELKNGIVNELLTGSVRVTPLLTQK
ncbi:MULTISPECIES: restriction endonuclease subunit S [unclassified Burkholderia]|uniref:restriction endonuclease subunit S n=1 Tax=unclassified Burkholderia TaxID=2613784 RepID=UPI000F58DDEA|nr:MULTISPECIES: restriction endonuclease subunit S [unclassified Burkholderia]RQR73091.1 restriction endonuclease subunit S [Burkholderia sp. Bp9011]RQR85073.1 restriction endonuclease subunit S [Burkholderia sp. Bp9010]RQS67814.1 restriction endonuclease subunit S [Burkholderia sp. Bp8977]